MRQHPRRTRLVFVHARKAGGTTTRQWLASKQCGRQGESPPKFTGFLSEGELVNVTRLSSPGTLWLTTMREPVARVVSQYFFEGRWPKLDPTASRSQRRAFGNSVEPTSFDAWVESVRRDRRKGSWKNLWLEVRLSQLGPTSPLTTLGRALTPSLSLAAPCGPTPASRASPNPVCGPPSCITHARLTPSAVHAPSRRVT